MPTLKQLTCSIDWGDPPQPLTEYKTAYSDGAVETHVAVPSLASPFSVRLRSNGYIAPGIAMFVYMDGIYQCNRNRQNLRIPDSSTTKLQTEIDFRVRQKEEMLPDGAFVGKQWVFEKLSTGISSSNNIAYIRR